MTDVTGHWTVSNGSIRQRVNRKENILNISYLTLEAGGVWTCLPYAQQSITKKMLCGPVESDGDLKSGRQPKRWTDNITEWTGLSIGSATKKTQIRGHWK